MTIHSGWHFLQASRQLQRADDRRVLGTWDLCSVDVESVRCMSGLHWSERPIDALYYAAPGGILCRVEVWGNTVVGDKGASQYRQIIWWIDAEMVLWDWLCCIATDALDAAGDPDPRSLAAIRLRRDWLGGRVVTAAEWDAARDAARDAAWDAAKDVARAVAWDAAKDAASWDAAWAVARDAARDAAWDAARDAARYAAWDAARDAQNERLEVMIRAEAKRLNIAEWDR